MRVDEALTFFENHPKVKNKLQDVLSEEEKRHQAEVNELKAQIKALQDAQAPVISTNKDDITLFIESKQKIHPL